MKGLAIATRSVLALGICTYLLCTGCIAEFQPAAVPDVPPPVAKSGPSFEATRDWIIAALSQYGGANFGNHTLCYSNVRISNAGILTFTSTDYLNEDNGYWDSQTVIIPLAAVTGVSDQQHDDASWWDVTVVTGNIAAVTTTNHKYGGYFDDPRGNGLAGSSGYILMGKDPQIVPGQPMPADSEDMANRLVKALQHMVDIFKGTYVAPAQATQPF